MSKKLYLVSHGDRDLGANPGHTPKGFGQIKALPFPSDVSGFVVGTGNRFQEILWSLVDHHNVPDTMPVSFSPFCGSADGLDPPDTIVLANSVTCKLGTNYIGLDSPHFDAWGFVDSQPHGTLFCSGGELLIALGLKDIYKKGHLYELNPEARIGKMVA